MIMITKQHFFYFSLATLLFLSHSTTTLAQPAAAPAATTAPSPPAPSPPAMVPSPPSALDPVPSGPTSVTNILEKAKSFTLFIRLLKSTAVSTQIDHQLNDSNFRMTMFAPPDNAFSSLSTGTLNSLNDQQKVLLIQFHVLPSYIPISRFKSVSNPLRTYAGDNSRYKYPLNVTSGSSSSSVNISTGITNATITGTIYNDGQLVIYQVDKVLLPYDLFGVKPLAPAPSPSPSSTPKNGTKSSDGSVDDTPADAKVDTSEATVTVIAMAMQNVVFVGVVATASAVFLF